MLTLKFLHCVDGNSSFRDLGQNSSLCRIYRRSSNVDIPHKVKEDLCKITEILVLRKEDILKEDIS